MKIAELVRLSLLKKGIKIKPNIPTSLAPALTILNIQHWSVGINESEGSENKLTTLKVIYWQHFTGDIWQLKTAINCYLVNCICIFNLTEYLGVG
jgi:hypothetical protein